jgi:hypothetical protein
LIDAHLNAGGGASRESQRLRFDLVDARGQCHNSEDTVFSGCSFALKAVGWTSNGHFRAGNVGALFIPNRTDNSTLSRLRKKLADEKYCYDNAEHHAVQY